MLVRVREAEAIIDVTSIEYHGGKTFIYFIDHSGKINSFNFNDPSKELFKKIWNDTRKVPGVMSIPLPDGTMELCENTETMYS